MEGTWNSRHIILHIGWKGSKEGVEVVRGVIVEENLKLRKNPRRLFKGRRRRCMVFGTDSFDDVLDSEEGVWADRASEVNDLESG